MRALFWLLTLTALAIGLALLGRISDGYVLWVIPPWRVELSLNLFVLAQLLALAVAYLLLRAINKTLNLPRVVGEYRARRARLRDERAAAEALRLLWEGRYGHALKSAGKVGAGGTASSAVLASLVGLKAAHALHDPERIAEWLVRARATASDKSDWRTARLMIEADLALETRAFDLAQTALNELTPKERRQISALRLDLRLAQGRSDWAEMLRITRLLEKHKALTAAQALPLRLRAQRGMLDGLQDEPAQLVRYWKGVPAAERLDLPLAQRAARALNNAGACAESARLIEDYLDDQWESVLLEDYVDCAGGDVLGRIAHCEKWLHEHANDAALLLALGRLCARQQLWGKAQSYLEASLAVAANCAVHIELARLCDQLERPDEANRHYRAAADCLAPSQAHPSHPPLSGR
ncbi:MAG: heme biosynthesis protein HemY [Gammaproteobacteria bacterium]|nr:heme biosynthesis protein HemY [Rhodocyclaceae bacterium]MBU3910578.1 heme biosynthesis protein HemY [Gammaproteobacteria bacterium]MBU3989241.1 heme biosynthesis protein HemY [Gammaproteobacteria bacterium]MBU4005059.1 heme biosynthesis protein HemY [Gammaproteobacteria bacterium]MBU4020652.1 heme biosynthesis protein HemY [Gammaproteobacteria bacterium]